MDYQIKNIKDEILFVDNVVPLAFQQSVIERIQGDTHFPWFLLHRIGHPDLFDLGSRSVYTDPNITDDAGFFHMAFDGQSNSPHYDFFRTILEFFIEKTNVQVGRMLRVRLRYTHKGVAHTSNKYAAPHVDFYTGAAYATFIYYVNNSDGDTIIFDKIFDAQAEPYNPVLADPLPELLRVTPKQGCGLFFNGHRYHAGNFPTDHSSRIVINFDFETA